MQLFGIRRRSGSEPRMPSVLIPCRPAGSFFFFNAARIEQHNAILDAEHQGKENQGNQEADGGMFLQERDKGDDVHGVSSG